MFISRPYWVDGWEYNIFQYAPNPVMWIDPWGLECVYRAVKDSEITTINQGLGIVKPKPPAKTTPTQQVGGVNHKNNPWTSTTTDYDIAKNKYGAEGAQVIKIDLSKIEPRNIVDVSTKTKANEVLKTQKARNYATADKEVLIKGDIPAEAIKLVN